MMAATTMAATTQWGPTGRSPGKLFSVAQLKRNIDDQLDVSKEIFQLVPKLAKIVNERQQDPELKKGLEEIMEELLSMGEKLTRATRDTGDKLLELLREPKT
jgi:hypothetical protein